MSKIRTFIGVVPPQRVINNIASVIRRLESSQASYNWVPLENLHVTLNFAGDVVDTEVPELCKLLKEVIETHPPFEMSLHGVGGFRDTQQPRTLWIGVDEGTEPLRALYKDIEAFLSHWGVNKDRNEFVPHMTLGRVRRGGRWNDDLLDKVHRLREHDGGFCSVENVKVFSSFLDRSGPTHTSMATIPLRGR